MIEIENINGKPKTIPDSKLGHHFDGEKFIFFESIEDKETYFNNIQVIFDKEEYKILITIEIDELILDTIKLYDYENISEVVAEYYPNGIWEQEALSILQWKSNLWMLRDNYFNILTEETIINNFTGTLPKYNG